MAKKKVFVSIAKLPVPKNKQDAGEIYAFLQAENCDAPAALVIYRLAIEGLPALLSHTNAEFKKHLIASRIKASQENDTACKQMTDSLKSTAAAIKDKKQKTQWAANLLKQAQGREKYIGRWGRISQEEPRTTASSLWT